MAADLNTEKLLKDAANSVLFSALTFGLGPIALDIAKRIHSIHELMAFAEKEVDQFGKMRSFDPIMLNVFNEVRRASKTNETILLLGETGTGKELFAEAIHFTSKRRKNEYVLFNIAGYPSELLESALFGHEKGAFTGAHAMKQGILETCNGGTVFLDEIGDAPIITQTKILRTLEEKKFKRLGGNKDIELNVRFICGTNKNPVELIKSGLMKLDFYFRINTFEIKIPSLKERNKLDKKYLTYFFLNELKKKNPQSSVKISRQAMNFIYKHSWPGNIRELNNALTRAFYKAEIENDHLINEKSIKNCVNQELSDYFNQTRITENDASESTDNKYKNLFTVDYFDGFSLKILIEEIEREYIKDAYLKCKTESKIGSLLGYSQQSIHNKLKKYLNK